jgi:hypothetical protein
MVLNESQDTDYRYYKNDVDQRKYYLMFIKTQPFQGEA